MRRWRRALAFQAALSGLVAFMMSALWLVTGGGTFWPKWVAYGLAIPFGLNAALFGAAQVRRRRWRIFAFHAALFTWVTATLVVTWAMAGSDEFWPLIPVVCLSMLLGVHGVVAAMTGGDPELVERVDELTRTRRGALDVQAHELRRIERDLHDGAQARLVALTMQLGRAEERLADHPEAAELVRQSRLEAGAAIAELRDLARGIAPPVLADRGLEAAVEALARRAPVPATVDVRLERRLPGVIETAAYFVVAESLTNVAKHARGASAEVRAWTERDRLVVEVADDGAGGADPSGGGLTGLRHRVEALDGSLHVTTGGDGTTIRAEIPCGS